MNGGYGWGTSDWSSAATAGSPKPKGGLVGGTLGYNVQTGGLVWGLEGDLDYSWIKGTDTGGTGVCAAPGCETRNTYLATGRGRIGFAADRWLPYLTGGAALGGLKMSPNNGLSQTKSKFGWTLGGGVEYAVTGAWSVKAEYLYVDLGRTTCSAATCGIDTDVKFKENIVRTGLNYRF
ncbi:MAG: porin family protein [Hyphomicrobiales bacterium]|nr:porin family protein [Hyphomicrobiales bacterium]